MSAAETARCNYEVARQEILLRMRLRDQALLVYLVVVGAILGVSFGAKGNTEILMTIPFIALGVAILVSQHNVLLVFLGQFCSEEIGVFLENKCSPSEGAPNWDNSFTFHLYAPQSTLFRLLSHGLIISVPCILALGLNWKRILFPFPQGTVWWFGLVCFVIALAVMLYAHNKRMRIYTTRNWKTLETH